jgi:sigma-B regulation protein RsbU (phosphoserine phosphatase)
MTRPHFDLSRWRRLAAFDGDSATALRTLAAHLRESLPDSLVALALTHDGEPGTCRLAGLIGPDGAEHVPNTDPFGRHTQLPLFDDALTARIFTLSAPSAIELDAAERGMPFAQALLGPATLLALPVVGQGPSHHWLLVGSTMHGRFVNLATGTLWHEANLAVGLLSRALALRNLNETSTRQHQEIEGLADIQRLLQPESIEIRGIDVAIHWQPAATAAGDYYDIMPLTQFAGPDYPLELGDVWGLMVADVSGHGAAAAMESVQFDAILRTYKGDEEPGGPAGALTYANRYFFSRRQRRHFLTVFAASFRPDKATLSYVSAGHPPALLRSGGEIRLLGKDDDGGIPLGILREHRWENVDTAFGAGDVLLMYTDGLIEAKDRRGRQFGVEGLADVLARAGESASAAEIVDQLRAALFVHQGSPIGADDQTVIVLRQL